MSSAFFSSKFGITHIQGVSHSVKLLAQIEATHIPTSNFSLRKEGWDGR